MSLKKHYDFDNPKKTHNTDMIVVVQISLVYCHYDLKSEDPNLIGHGSSYRFYQSLFLLKSKSFNPFKAEVHIRLIGLYQCKRPSFIFLEIDLITKTLVKNLFWYII